MRLEELPSPRPLRVGGSARHARPVRPAREAVAVLSVFLLLASAPDAPATEAPEPPATDERPEHGETASDAADPAVPATAAASIPDSSPTPASIDGSLTLRYQASEGSGNDRASARLSLEWLAGRWSGGFTALLENQVLDGAIHSEPGIGSLDLPERWIGWSRELERTALDFRLGTAHGLRFGEGLVFGAARFDGLQAAIEHGPMRFIAVAGRTESLTPEDFLFEPLTLFPPDEEETFGSDGELAGVRAEITASERLRVGTTLLSARADGLPRADLAGVDVWWTKGRLDLSAELAARSGGGHAMFLRADVVASDEVVVGIERRDYRDFGSPLGNAPLYGGLSAGDDRDEDGWLLRVDFVPHERISGSWSFDYSDARGKQDEGAAGVRRDHRLALDFRVGERTAIGYGFELEDTSGGEDGQIHSVLVSHAFESGGRLSGRLSLDRSTPGWRTTMRTSWRQPLAGRRITLLFDDTVRIEGGSIAHAFTAGLSMRVGESSFITVRATTEAGAADSIDATWYRRF